MNKQILFVDADPLLMDVHAMVLEKTAAHWNIARAENSEHALAILAAKKFDAVVADLRTPGTNGIVLLQAVRRLFPQIARVSVSELDERKKTSGQPKVTNPFLASLTTQELFATLLRSGKFDTVLSDENLKSLTDHWHSAPSPRLVSLQIIHELNAQTPSLEAIADLALQYPALTEKLLRTANSAAYARKTKTAHPLDAIQYLGLNVIRSIVLSAHVFRDYEHTDLQEFTATDLWDKAHYHTQITQLLMQLESPETTGTEAAGSVELLHHTGKLMLAKNSLPRAAHRINSHAAKDDFLFSETGRKIADISRTSESVNLFGHWGLGTLLVEAVAFQLQPASKEIGHVDSLRNGTIAHARPTAFVPSQTFDRMPAADFDFLADINVNERMNSLRYDV